MMQSVRLSDVLVFLSLSILPFQTAVAGDDGSGAHLEIITDFGANCVARSAKQLLIVNHHSAKPIKVKLFRYFGGVRQPGRSVHTLQPGDEPQALGCDRIQGRDQHWKINSSGFVE